MASPPASWAASIVIVRSFFSASSPSSCSVIASFLSLLSSAGSIPPPLP